MIAAILHAISGLFYEAAFLFLLGMVLGPTLLLVFLAGRLLLVDGHALLVVALGGEVVAVFFIHLKMILN